MKKTACLLFAASSLFIGSSCRIFSPSCCPSQPAAEPVADTPALDLFNGKDLAGWEGFLAAPEGKPEEVWMVRDGLLVCTGEPLGFLRTRGSFTHFVMEVEWRWAPGGEPGNNGVLMRINGGPQKGIPRCLEMQLRHGSAGDLYGFFGMMVAGDADRQVSKPGHALLGDMSGVKAMRNTEKAPGEWNLARIRVERGTIQVWINGELVNEARDCDVLAGPVGIQSEGGEIHFRTIRLTPLP